MGNGPSVDAQIDAKINIKFEDAEGNEQIVTLKADLHPELKLRDLMDMIQNNDAVQQTLLKHYRLNKSELQRAKGIRIMYNNKPTPIGDLLDMAAEEVAKLDGGVPEVGFRVSSRY